MQQELRVLLEHKEHKEHKDIRVDKDLLVLKDLWVHRVHKADKALLVQ